MSFYCATGYARGLHQLWRAAAQPLRVALMDQLAVLSW